MKQLDCFMILVAILLMATISCQKGPSISFSGERTITVSADGGTKSLSFSTNRDWTVSSSESWCRVSPPAGAVTDGNVSITITVDKNNTYEPRSCTLTIKAEDITESVYINQEFNYGLIVSPTTLDITNAAQSIEVTVKANVKYDITIDSEGSKWITHTGTKGLSTEKATFSIAANNEYDGREGRITFKQKDGSISQTVTVRQSQTNGLFITTPDYELSNEEHTLSVEVKSNVYLTVTSQANWITHVGTKGLTTSTITLSVAPNESFDERTGTVLVKQSNGDLSGTITITQKQTDGLFVTPTEIVISDKEQDVELGVQNNVSYDVVIPDEAKTWISMKSNTSTKALADNKVVLAIAQNSTYSGREASITVKQVDGPLSETVKITQLQNDAILVSSNQIKVSEFAQTYELIYNTNVDCKLIIPDDVTWISNITTKALSEKGFTLSIAETDEYEPRSAEIIISDQAEIVKQSITITQDAYTPVYVTKPIPDNVFFAYLIENFDINGDKKIDQKEAKKVKSLDCSNKSIVSLSGIENFASLKELNCSKTNISELDLSENTALTFILCQYNESLEKVTLPKISTINDSAFLSCTSLKELELPNTITSIGQNAFQNCSGMKKLIIRSDINSPYSKAFSGACIEDLTITDKATEVSHSMFRNEPFLKHVKIGANVSVLRHYAFADCKALIDVCFEKNSKLKQIEPTCFSNSTSLSVLDMSNCAEISSIASDKHYEVFGGHESQLTIYIGTVIPPSTWYIYTYKCKDGYGGLNMYWFHLSLHVPDSSIDAYKNDYNWYNSDYVTISAL